MSNALTTHIASSGWKIPAYLQSHLYVETPHETVQAKGDVGLFTLTQATDTLDLVMGGAGGTRIARLAWQHGGLGWRGDVRIGGMVDSMTLLTVNEQPLSAANVAGLLMKPNARPCVNAGKRGIADMEPMSYREGLFSLDDDEQLTTWVMPEGGGFAAMLESAMFNSSKVWMVGEVATEGSGLHTHFALPLVLQQLTVFSEMH